MIKPMTPLFQCQLNAYSLFSMSQFHSAGGNLLEKNAIVWHLCLSSDLCENTAPTLVSEASTLTMKGCNTSECFRIGAVGKVFLSLANAYLAASFHTKCLARFLRRNGQGWAIELKHQMNCLQKIVKLGNLCSFFTVLDVGLSVMANTLAWSMITPQH